MPLVPCKECSTPIATSARTCPQCGARRSRTRWWFWVPIYLLMIFFAFPYIAYSPAERAAIRARAECERAFPAERGRQCDAVYDRALSEGAR